jgi:hypothetical protein
MLRRWWNECSETWPVASLLSQAVRCFESPSLLRRVDVWKPCLPMSAVERPEAVFPLLHVISGDSLNRSLLDL